MWRAGLMGIVFGNFFEYNVSSPFCTLCLILARGLGGQGILSQYS